MKNKKAEINERYQGLRGNTNAAKADGVRREAMIHARTTPEAKIRFIRLANEQGLKLSDWINNALDKYADEQEANDDKAAD